MKTKLLFVALIATFFSSAVIAQPVVKKQKVIGGNDGDFLSDFAITKNDKFIMGGTSFSVKSGDKSENNVGQKDYWIVKLKENGAIDWDNAIGGSDFDIFSFLQQTTDNGFFIGGFSSSNASGDKTENSKGWNDYWIVKTDGYGNVKWDKTIGGNDDDELEAGQQTMDGGYILGGSSESDASGDKSEDNRKYLGLYGYGSDYWIVKTDQNGKIEWDKTIGGSSNDILTTIHQTSDGGYIVGGYSNSDISGEKTEGVRGTGFYYDYWILKLDGLGNIQWQKTIGAGKDDMLEKIELTADGGYVLAGSSRSQKGYQKSEGNKGDRRTFDYWVVKLDASGNIQWDKTLGGSSDEGIRDILVCSDGGYLAGGYSYSNASGDKTENSRGGTDFWIVKLNSNGEIEWDKTIGGNDADYLMNIQEYKKNDFILAGYSDSDVSGEKTQPSKGYIDYWIVELKYKSTGIESPVTPSEITSKDLNEDQGEIVIYPNPAKDLLQVQLKGTSSFALINSSGKIMMTKQIVDKGFLNIKGLPAGLYYLKNLTTGNSQKVIISK